MAHCLSHMFPSGGKELHHIIAELEGCEKNLEAVKTILGIGENFSSRVLGHDHFEYPLFLNYAMIARQVHDEKRYEPPPTSGTRLADPTVMQLAALYSHFAMASYESGKELIAKVIPGFSVRDIVCTHETSCVSSPNFYIAEDPVSDTVVICVRGTQTPSDVLTDLLCDTVPFMGGLAHRGMSTMAEEVAERVAPHLENILNTSTKRIAFVGHSLGAGVVILTMVRLFGKVFDENVLTSGRVQCFAYAPPAVFEPACELPASLTSSIYSFVNDVDCIPRIGPNSVAQLLYALKNVDAMPFSLRERWDIARGKTVSPVRLPDALAVPEDIRDEFGALEHVGRLFLIYAGHGGETVCDEVAPGMLDRLLPHPNMISSHLCSEYVKYTSKINEDCCRERHARSGRRRNLFAKLFGGRTLEKMKLRGGA